jgi:hypothetical protein
MQVLLPGTVARLNGTGAEIALASDRGKPLLLTLEVNRIVEQESLEVSIWGSPDRQIWTRLSVFPRKDYCGSYAQMLDLSMYPDIEFLRTDWKVIRWGSGETTPLFEFSVSAQELKMHAVGA